MSSTTATSPQILPRVSRPANEEIAAAREVIAHLNDYQSKNWGIGLNGSTFEPDGFLSFFTRRQLPFNYYVVNYGASIGSSAAYQENINTLENYINELSQRETEAVHTVIAQLEEYQSRFWAIGLNGDTLMPDDFNVFFASRGLSFKPFVRSTSGVNIGEENAYEVNINTLHEYLSQVH